MKVFQKVLAILLSAVMILSLVPISVFAAPAGGGVTQGPKGTGADGTVTVSVSASQLAALIRALGDSDEAVDKVRDMISREGSTVTVSEIVDILPVGNMIDAVIGQNGENLGVLIDRLGGIDHVLTLVDVNALIDAADANDLADFAAGISGIETVVDTAKLRTYLSGLGTAQVKALFGDNFNAFADAVADAIVAGELTDNNGNPLTISDLIDFAAIDPNDFEDEIGNNSAVLTQALSDMLEAGVNIPDVYTVATDRLTSDTGVQNRLIADLRANPSDILTPAGMTAAAELFAEDAAAVMTDEDLRSLLSNSQVVNGLVSYINDDMEHGTGDNAKALLNDAGRAWLDDQINNHGLTTFTAAEIETIRTNNYYNAATCAARVINIVVNETTLDLADYVDVSDVLTAATISSEKVNTLFGTAANYKKAGLFNSVVNAIAAGGQTLSDFVNIDVPALVNDAGVAGFFRNHVTDYFSASEIVDILGNKLSDYLRSDIYSYTSLVAVAKEYISVQALLRKMVADGEDLSEYVDVDALVHLPGIDYGALFNLFPRSVLISQLKDDIRELWGALTNDQRTTFLSQALTAILDRFKKVTVEGYTVAANDGRVLRLDAEALVAAVWEVLPKLSELSDESFDGTVLSFNATADYLTDDGVAKHKDINFVFKVTSGVSTVRRAAALLDRYVSVAKNGNQVSVEIDMPGIVADLYRKALESGDTEAINSLREKVLAMEGMNGVDLVNAFADIPLSEIIAALRDVDADELYTRLVNAGMVQRVADKLEELAGISYDLSRIDTLDELLDQLRRDDLPTVETIVSKLSDKVNADLMEMLEKVAKTADEKGYTEKLIEKAKSLPKIGKYLDGITAEDVLNDYKGMNPVRAVATFLSDRLGRDLVSKVYADYTAEELYNKALDFADARLAGYYRSFQNLVVNLSDPDYEPTNRYVRFIQSLIPAKALSAFRGHSLTDVYRGDSTFSASVENVSVDLEKVVDRLFGLIDRVHTLDEDLEATLRGFLPTGSVNFGVSLKVNFTNVYKVTYFDKDGGKLLTTFLPRGVNPTVIKVPEIDDLEVKGWADAAENGEIVNAITGDCSLWATYEETLSDITFRFYDDIAGAYGDDVTIQVRNGESVAAADIPSRPPVGLDPSDYTAYYYRGDSMDPADEITVDDITAAIVDGAATYTIVYRLNEKHKVTFRVFDGTNYTEKTVQVNDGEKLTAIPAYTVPANLVPGGYTVTYFEGSTVSKDGDTVTEAEILSEVILGDVTYAVAFLPKGIAEDADALVYLTTDDDDNWTVTVLDATDFAVTINLENALTDDATSITVKSGKVAVKIGEYLLDDIRFDGAENIRLISKRSAAAKNFTVSNGIYTATAQEAYDLDLILNADDENNGTRLTDFDGGLEVTVTPQAITAIPSASANANQRTNAYIVDANGVITGDDLHTTVTAAGDVSFFPPHFTEVIIVNEYRLSVEFTGTVLQGTLKVGDAGVEVGDGIMIPEGATVKKLVPSIGAAATTNYIESMTCGETEIAIGGDFVMPSANAVITVKSAATTFIKYFVLPDGTVMNDRAQADAWLAAHADTAPKGYLFKAGTAAGTFAWENDQIDPQTVQANVFCTPALTAKEYTIIFQPGHDAAVITLTFTIEQAQNGTFLPPAMPEIGGYRAVKWGTYDLLGIINGTAQNVVTGTYTERTYTVTYVNGTTAEFKKGAAVDPKTGYTATAGYELDKIVYVSEDGTETEVTESTFAMPADAVRVVITERPKTAPIVINGVTYRGTIGGVLTFPIELAEDEVLKQAPAGARLVSFTTGRNGSRTLLYAVDISENNPDLNYRVGKRSAASENEINNGVLNGEADSRAARYNTTKDLTFPSAVYSVAVYENEGALHSFTWLWILLIVLLVIAVIALLYLLIIRKGLGPNFFTRLIVGIVAVFFTMCLGVYMLFTGKAFKKKNEANGEADGEADENADGEAEEPAEDADSEANGEANAEADGEEPAEEAADEPADENADENSETGENAETDESDENDKNNENN